MIDSIYYSLCESPGGLRNDQLKNSAKSSLSDLEVVIMIAFFP